MNFLDANIIAYSFYQNENQEKCQNVLIQGGIIDTLVLIEAFNIIEHETNRDNAIVSIRGILKSDIRVIDADLGIIFECLKKASSLKKLKFLDLVHYTVAKIMLCESIVSYDRDFNGLDIPRIEA